ncbi:MAG: hypothetical protein AAGC56_13655, partial [Pseudomonadota bacterium]
MQFETPDGDAFPARVDAWRTQAMRLRGVPPDASVAVSSTLQTPHGAWRAARTFDPVRGGVLDPLAADPGWPWWSVAPAAPTGGLTARAMAAGFRLDPDIDPLAALTYELTATAASGETARVAVVRERAPADVAMRRVAEGRLRGLFFTPEGRDPQGGVLVLGGSEGGLPAGRAAARA